MMYGEDRALEIEYDARLGGHAEVYGEDSHLEAAYEDRNGDPDGDVYDPFGPVDYAYRSEDEQYDEEPNPYHGTYSEE